MIGWQAQAGLTYSRHLNQKGSSFCTLSADRGGYTAIMNYNSTSLQSTLFVFRRKTVWKKKSPVLIQKRFDIHSCGQVHTDGYTFESRIGRDTKLKAGCLFFNVQRWFLLCIAIFGTFFHCTTVMVLERVILGLYIYFVRDTLPLILSCILRESLSAFCCFLLHGNLVPNYSWLNPT